MAEAKNFGKNTEQNQEDLGNTAGKPVCPEAQILREYEEEVLEAFKFEYKRMLAKLRETQRKVQEINTTMCNMKANYLSGNYFEDQSRGCHTRNPNSLNFGQY